jgi:hypothetical protein
MDANELRRLRGDSLSLEPLKDDLATAASKTKAPAQFKVDTRKQSDRRKGGERRETLRFQEDRRQKDRRPRKTWESGKNL